MARSRGGGHVVALSCNRCSVAHGSSCGRHNADGADDRNSCLVVFSSGRWHVTCRKGGNILLTVEVAGNMWFAAVVSGVWPAD